MSRKQPQSSNVERNLERMKVFRDDIGKTVKTAVGELAKCQLEKEASAKVMRSHAAIVKVTRNLVEMVQDYDKSLKLHDKLLTAYHELFNDLMPQLEALQRSSFSIQKTGSESVLDQSDVVSTVKYLDNEFRKLRGSLGSSSTGRNIDDYLTSEHAAYTALAQRANSRAPPPPVILPRQSANAKPRSRAPRSRRVDGNAAQPRSRRERPPQPPQPPREDRPANPRFS